MNGDWKIPWARPVLHGNEGKYLEEAFRSTWISGGAFVERFERDMAAFLGAPHTVAVASGTAALHLSLLAADVGPGDEVILPALTFAGCAAMVGACGATPLPGPAAAAAIPPASLSSSAPIGARVEVLSDCSPQAHASPWPWRRVHHPRGSVHRSVQ